MRQFFLALALVLASGTLGATTVAPCGTGDTCARFPTHPTHAYRAFTLVRELSVDFVAYQPTRVRTRGHLEFVSRYDTVMGVAAKIGYRCVPIGSALPAYPGTRAPTSSYLPPPAWSPGGKSGANIVRMEAHYASVNLGTAGHLIGPGVCRVEVWITSHTDAYGYGSTDGLAQINTGSDSEVTDTYGFFEVDVLPN